MTARFYTEQRLNRDLEVHEFQSGGSMRYPLDLERIGSLPPALGATTLPPQGAFSTETDVSNLSRLDGGQNAQKPQSLVSPLYAAAALVAAYMLFLPMAI